MRFDIDELAAKFIDAVFTPDEAPGFLRELDQRIKFAAAKQATKGTMTPSDISTLEELDPEDKVARLYWSYVSTAYAQVMTRAASKLVHWN